MNSDPESWQLRSPGDLDLLLPRIHRTDPAPRVEQAHQATNWSRLTLEERWACLEKARDALRVHAEELALDITLETGKPIKEARGELSAVVAKFDLTRMDAERHLADESVTGGPHPGWIRRRPRGVAAVIAPFNFPLHLGHGATVAHLLAGNPVILKPSPLAAAVAGRYAGFMSAALPEGVFGVVQGAADTGTQLCLHPQVRSVCFTGSASVGRHLARALASELGKELALELGGKNAAIVCADADLAIAAAAVAEGLCLTAGQRCNSTSRVLVDHRVASAFKDRLLAEVAVFQPGDPLLESTRLGPLIHERSRDRYRQLCEPASNSDFLLPGQCLDRVDGKRGHFVSPAILLRSMDRPISLDPLWMEETFCPLLVVQEYHDVSQAVEWNNAVTYGLTCSVFTRSEPAFRELADRLFAGNIYANLPTTFSPSTLPFGGWGDSGNRRPGGRGFIRFTTEEQAMQIAQGSFRALNSH